MFHLHQGSRYGVKIHCRYLINRQGSCARNNGLRLVNVAGGRDIDRAIKPRGKSVACTRACSRRVSRCHDEQALLSCIGTSSTRAYGRSSGNLYCLRIRKSPWRLPILFTGFAATMESSKGAIQRCIFLPNVAIYRRAQDWTLENNTIDNGHGMVFVETGSPVTFSFKSSPGSEDSQEFSSLSKK